MAAHDGDAASTSWSSGWWRTRVAVGSGQAARPTSIPDGSAFEAASCCRVGSAVVAPLVAAAGRGASVALARHAGRCLGRRLPPRLDRLRRRRSAATYRLLPRPDHRRARLPIDQIRGPRPHRADQPRDRRPHATCRPSPASLFAFDAERARERSRRSLGLRRVGAQALSRTRCRSRSPSGRPFALWQDDGKLEIIDRGGDVITDDGRPAACDSCRSSSATAPNAAPTRRWRSVSSHDRLAIRASRRSCWSAHAPLGPRA